MVYDIVYGTDAPLFFQLLDNGSPIDLTACTITIVTESSTGSTPSLTATIVNAPTGLVSLSIGITLSYSFSPYLVRWKITDAGGKISYVPTTSRDSFNILKP